MELDADDDLSRQQQNYLDRSMHQPTPTAQQATVLNGEYEGSAYRVVQLNANQPIKTMVYLETTNLIVMTMVVWKLKLFTVISDAHSHDFFFPTKNIHNLN